MTPLQVQPLSKFTINRHCKECVPCTHCIRARVIFVEIKRMLFTEWRVTKVTGVKRPLKHKNSRGRMLRWWRGGVFPFVGCWRFVLFVRQEYYYWSNWNRTPVRSCACVHCTRKKKEKKHETVVFACVKRVVHAQYELVTRANVFIINTITRGSIRSRPRSIWNVTQKVFVKPFQCYYDMTSVIFLCARVCSRPFLPATSLITRYQLTVRHWLLFIA